MNPPDRRVTERRIHPAVAEFAVAENARLAEQIRVLREVLASVCKASLAQLEGHGRGIEPSENLKAAYEKASSALATAPRDAQNTVLPGVQNTISKQPLSEFGRVDQDMGPSGSRLKEGS